MIAWRRSSGERRAIATAPYGRYCALVQQRATVVTCCEQSPLHDRVAAANQTSLWSHWAGHLVVDKYQMSEKFEYVAIRNAAGVFDSSPLYKYRIVGPDAERYLAGVLTRDIRTCRPGQAQYTIWCDDRGFVNEDGVVFRHSADEFMLTAAEPNLPYFQNLVGSDRVEITEVTYDSARSLAVQGPRSRAILASARPGGRASSASSTTRRRRSATSRSRSRAPASPATSATRSSADADDAEAVWDAVFEAGTPHGLIPFGQTALLMARIEAGLLLIARRLRGQPPRRERRAPLDARSSSDSAGCSRASTTTPDRSSAARRSAARTCREARRGGR